MLLSLQPSNPVISDANTELINLFKVVKDHPNELFSELDTHQNTPEHYYYVRELDREPGFHESDPVKRAARIIFLNKTCFNGLFRVNSQGFFNVPYGYYKKPQYKEYSKIMAVSEYLNRSHATILSGDYQQTAPYISKGTFLYVDPPYAPITETSNFTGYTNSGFNTLEQIRLRDFCKEMSKRGAMFMQSNSNSPLIRELYSEFSIHEVKAPRNVAAASASRGEVEELVITNY